MSQPYQQGGARRQGEQHSSEAEQVTKREQRENHGQWMQPDSIADEPRYQDVTLEQLPDAVNRENGDKARPAMPLQQGGEHPEDESQSEADVGHEDEQTGQDANRHRELQSDDQEAYDVIHGEYAHHRELPAQEFGQHAIDLARQRAHGRQPTPRQQFVDTREDVVPVAKQIEHHHGDECNVDQDGEQQGAPRLDAFEQPERDRLSAGKVLGDQLFHRCQVHLQLDPQLVAEPRRDLSVERHGQLRQPLAQLHEFRLNQRIKHNHQGKQQQKDEDHH